MFKFLLVIWVALASPAWSEVLQPVPPLVTHITDTLDLLPPGTRDALEHQLTTLETDKGAQVAVLIVATTRPEAIEQYALRVAEVWRLGRPGVDDGVLFLVARDDRRMRVEVGRGLEGALPDAIAKRIISDVVTPHFRQGDFAAGVVAGVTALDVRVRGEELPLPAETSGTSAGDDLRSEVGDVFGLALAASFVLGSIFRAIFGRLSGAALVGALVGAGVWLMTGLVAAAGVAGLVAFLSSLLSGGHGRAVNGRGSWPGGRGGSGGGGRGGWSGGGGSFGGGGASGNW